MNDTINETEYISLEDLPDYYHKLAEVEKDEHQKNNYLRLAALTAEIIQELE